MKKAGTGPMALTPAIIRKILRGSKDLKWCDKEEYIKENTNLVDYDNINVPFKEE